ncbi:hypothetical protein F5148DRAFT_1154679, partial [Russula earlei]
MAHNTFSLPDGTWHSKPAPRIQAYLGDSNDTGPHVSRLSSSRPRGRRDTSASDATVSRGSRPSVSGAAIAGVLVACLVILLLLFLPCYLKRRRRKLQSKPVNNAEDGVLQQPNPDSFATVMTTYDLPPRKSSHSPSISQSSSITAVSVGRPTSSSSQVSDVKSGKERLPARPPPLVLRPERSKSETRRGNPSPMAKRGTIRTVGGSRVSVLPNPWDGEARPPSAAFERMDFQLPSLATSPLRPANSFKAGLPRTPRQRRTFVSPEVRPLEDAPIVADVDGVGNEPHLHAGTGLMGP